jgi:putative Ca2+/H+ antiporter (TMEM165/GDT1 family)
MDWTVFFTTLGTIFLAELGDKTQLAAIMMTLRPAALLVFGGQALSYHLIGVLRVGLTSIVPHILKKALPLLIISGWMFFENSLAHLVSMSGPCYP